ncbi:MAG: CAP domain-containing protein [Acidobacteria bacterium]|nr:CAP domain-containing protein [Acidobacteriota bacterium]
MSVGQYSVHMRVVGWVMLLVLGAGTPLVGHAAPAERAAVTTYAYLPLVLKGQPSPPADKNDIPAYVNYFRALAGVPAVTFDPVLDNNCYLHARYMAEENEITHDERTDSPWYTPEGQVCAQNGNAWLGSEFYVPYWQQYHSIESWMSSVGHRLWLLYPTTPVFGFGFYTAANNRAGAGLDVLSNFNSGADASYPGWPVRYPAPGQSDVPAEAYAITLNWAYFGAMPTISTTSLTTLDGTPIAHTATTTELAASHKGIQVVPDAALPANTTFTVSASGTYDGTPFTYTWFFSTGE